MNPTIQMIHLALRSEREEKAQRQSFMKNQNETQAEKVIYPLKVNHSTKLIFKSAHQQPCCECV